MVTGTVISSTVFNAFTADIGTGLSTCVLKDGTQTITGNIPMSSFKLTGLAAGTAAGNSVRWEQAAPGVLTTTGDVLYASSANTPARLAIGTARQQVATNSAATAPEWVASLQSLLTTTGDTIQTTAANTPARLAATASVAAHATTSDIWTARETILTGVAVTFTAVANAPYVSAVAWVYQNAAHIWTDGAVFDVQGNQNYTADIGDWVRINAVTVSTFDVTIFKANGTAVGTSVATAAEIKTGTATNKYLAPDAFLSALGFSAAFTSAAQTLTSAGALTIAHSLGRRPIWYITTLKCLTGEAGFSVGDYLFIDAGGPSSGDNRGTTIVPDATNINIRFGSAVSVYTTLNKTTGVGVALTNANWEAYFTVLA